MVETFGEPAPLMRTFETKIGGAAALAYVTVPEIDASAVGAAVGVFVDVFVAVAVGVFVAVGVGVAPLGTLKA